MQCERHEGLHGAEVDDRSGSSEPYNACRKDEGFDTLVDDVDGFQGPYACLDAKAPTAPAWDEPVTEE